MPKPMPKLLAAVTMTVLVGACGGGGSSGPTTPEEAVEILDTEEVCDTREEAVAADADRVCRMVGNGGGLLVADSEPDDELRRADTIDALEAGGQVVVVNDVVLVLEGSSARGAQVVADTVDGKVIESVDDVD